MGRGWRQDIPRKVSALTPSTWVPALPESGSGAFHGSPNSSGLVKCRQPSESPGVRFWCPRLCSASPVSPGAEDSAVHVHARLFAVPPAAEKEFHLHPGSSSVRGAAGSPARQQLEPEGPSSSTGKHQHPGVNAPPTLLPLMALLGGMGSKPSPCSSLQGFGFTSERSGSPSAGEALLATIQKAAEVVASAVLPSPEFPRPCPRELQDDAYQPVTAPSPGKSCVVPPKPPAAAAHSLRVSHQPGQAGGGWEETDSGHSSQNSSQENGELSRTSDSYSKSGSDSPSGASRELGNVTERVEGDCLQELSLVSALTRGSKVFLTREEAQHFIKECGLLNCEVVLELLSRTLQDPSQLVCMRSMCAISSLLCSDLLAHEQISGITRPHLQQLSQRSPGPVANKATKLLRQCEALCRSYLSPKRSQPDADPPAPAGGSPQHPRDLLTDLMPLAGETVLKPVSLAPFLSETWKAPAFGAHPAAVPAPAGEQGTEAETWEQFGDVAPGRRCQQEVECRLTGPEAQLDAAWMDSGSAETLNGGRGAAAPPQSLSLFAGMELVALPGTAVANPGGEGCASRVPRTLPRTGTASAKAHRDSEGSREPSAFSFLNM
ncbi:Small nuclear ribonucleoprotein F [Platysternon megacephalum]|uniref:Small nuclear ribonucleoprotein F n=1 Tax=Platysternon megacephalum TaxID=55544 RepID=A0A4D9E6L1_9SAUR|nr:Small nuclear ribonucleoprotein F [Platysternon megacephalum]